MPPKYRRSSAISFFWEDGRLICEEYLQLKRIEASPEVIPLLNGFDAYRGLNEVIEAFGAEFKKDDLERVLGELVRLGFLIPEKGLAEAYQEILRAWHWPEPARSFFFSTKDSYECLEKSVRTAYVKAFHKSGKQPPLYKDYNEVPTLKLPAPGKLPGTFAGILKKRRSSRRFSSKPLSAKELSTLLFHVWGEQGRIKTEAFGELLKKTSASGGARHPIEVYPLIANVSGIAPGAYHYNVKDQTLEQLRAGSSANLIWEATNRQDWFKEAAVCFVMTAVFARASWKYRNARALRNIFMDVGHLSQTLYLTAESLKKGCCITSALTDSKIEKILLLDGISESVISVSAVGPAK